MFAVLLAASVALWWHPLSQTLRLALTNDAHTHIILIVPLALALIYLDRDRLPNHPQSDWAVGGAMLLLAALLGAFAKWEMITEPNLVRLFFLMVALVTWWIASIILCFGIPTLRGALVPLCFLFLIAPIPEFALTRIVEFLQYDSAFAARLMFRAIGVPATQDGIMLSVPGLDIEVATECSSIRSSMILLVTTIVLAQLFLRSWWRKSLLILATIPLAVAKNGLRIFTIVELGTRVNRQYLTGKLHHQGGILFWGVAVIAIAVLLYLLRKSEVRIVRSSSLSLPDAT